MRSPLRHPAGALVSMSVCLFAIYAAWTPSERETISVTAEIIEQITEQRAELLGRALNEEQRQAIIEAYVEDEVLVREAFRQGLDRNDRRVRGFLISDARLALIGRDVTAPEPTTDQLREYYEDNRDQYVQREAVTIEYLYFVPGPLPESAETILAQLNAGVEPGTIAAGGGQTGRSVNVTQRTISMAQGRAFADAVMAVETGRWTGPLRSTRGTYFNFIVERRAGRELAFEKVQDWIERDWEERWYRSQLQEALAGLRGRYEVELSDGEPER